MKKIRRKPFNRAEAWRKTQLVLASNNVEGNDTKMASSIMLPVFLAIEDLQHGRLQRDKFAFLVQMNAAALCLCQLLYESGTESTKAAMVNRKPVIFAAADAFGQIGERWAERDQFVATGNELRTIREASEVMASLTETVPRGMLLRSLREAEAMTAAFYAQKDKAAA